MSKKVKILYIAIGFILCIFAKLAEEMFLIEYSQVHMLKNAELVPENRISKLLNGDEDERQLAYGILERRRSNLGENLALSDLQSINPKLQVSAADYLASIGNRESINYLFEILKNNKFNDGRNIRLFYLHVMGIQHEFKK